MLLQSIVGYGVAQNCDFSKNETDKFTNSRVLYTKPINVISGKIKVKNTYTVQKIEMQVKYENGRHFISLDYHLARGKGRIVATIGDKVILLLSNGSTVEARYLQGIPSYEARDWVEIFSYNFGISVEDFMLLLEYNITDIRMSAQINPIDFSIDSKIKTTELFNCINNNK